MCLRFFFKNVMKKYILTLFFVIAAFSAAQAQVWIGGSLNADLNKEAKTITIGPEVGYCFPETPFTVGCGVEYSGTFQQGEAYTHSLSLSPFFRYDICDIEDRFTPFIDLYSDIEVLDFSFFEIGLSPGVSFDLTEHWSAEFSYGFLGYQQEKLPDDAMDRNFGLSFATATGSFSLYYNF